MNDTTERTLNTERGGNTAAIWKRTGLAYEEGLFTNMWTNGTVSLIKLL